MRRIECMEDLIDYIYESIGKRGDSVSSLEIRSGLSPGIISRWRKKKTGGPLLLTAMEVLKALDTDIYLDEIEENVSSREREEKNKRKTKEKIVEEILKVSEDTEMLEFLEILIKALLKKKKPT